MKKSISFLAMPCVCALSVLFISSCATDPYKYDPEGTSYSSVPTGYMQIMYGGIPYWYYDDHYCRHWPDHGYVVVPPPHNRPPYDRPPTHPPGGNRPGTNPPGGHKPAPNFPGYDPGRPSTNPPKDRPSRPSTQPVSRPVNDRSWGGGSGGSNWGGGSGGSRGGFSGGGMGGGGMRGGGRGGRR